MTQRSAAQAHPDTAGTTPTPTTAKTERPGPPLPEQRFIERTHHGDTVRDPYDWLRDKDNQTVLDHLHAENAYTDSVTEPLRPLRDAIVAEIKSHTQETDLSVPDRDGEFWYVMRTTEGEQYPTYSRIPDTGSRPTITPGVFTDDEQMLLDCPRLAEGSEFFRLGGVRPSPDHTRLAYSVDVTGDEHFDLRVLDIHSGDVIDDAVRNIGYGFAFSCDGQWLFYTRVNDAWRQHQVWRHRIGSDAATDTLIFEEKDEKFSVYPFASRDGQFFVIVSASSTSSECYLQDLSEPESEPRSIAPRRPGVEYMVEVAGDHLLIVHNDGHINFQVARAELNSEDHSTWQPVLTAGPGERITGVDAFESAAAVSLRSGGLARVRILPRKTEAPTGWDVEAAWDLGTNGPLDTVELDTNLCWQTSTLRYQLTSMLTPRTICEADLSTRHTEVLRETPVPGFDRSRYVEHREWAIAEDGTRIPLSVVHRADLSPDGTNPGYLYGYGSYEISIDPYFSVANLSMLDRGVVIAIAHIRGGGEMGREWYEQGKLLHKKNTFSDFVAAGRHLVSSGWVQSGRLAAEGRSAGGLLMGAVANLAPDLFRVILAGVPFVDALTTILDPSLPLTVGEWEEWGNPLEDPEVYAYMKEYSPYENIKPCQYPAIFAATSLNDIRVFYVEPAKWVARLRETVTNDLAERPIVLRCEMVAGHGGRSGRYNQWEQRAEEVAFLLDQLDATQVPSPITEAA
ncbi:S9 family peptidase [Devriesea agamarum]|uniref:S9 family peptidase n=1 Tax=Devriesea agamarum TaxID=472569 RepID=UPI000A03CE3F|nr:S9 family peptidase [Devriesea agamarum]